MSKLPSMKCLVCGKKLKLLSKNEETRERVYRCYDDKTNGLHHKVYLNHNKQIYLSEFHLLINNVNIRVQIDNGLPDYDKPNGVEPYILIYNPNTYLEEKIMCNFSLDHLTVEKLTDKIKTITAFV